MKKLILINIFCALLSSMANTQELTQTVRGTILDNDNNLPLIGATVVISNSDPVKGTIADANGVFRLEQVPVGRITLSISYLGYENKIIPNIMVNSGKETVLEISLQETTEQLNAVTIKYRKNNGEPVNELSVISARSVSLEQTQRYAGSINDPSHILANFAGITNTQDGGSDIIIRGNSPKYVQWRLEGVEITNPNHFEDQNSSSGGICALNNNLLATSDFYTGAFSPEYGDVLSGVYDVKLRSGNNEKFESTFGFGILGTDFTIEGPFRKGYSGSYLLNYRYSTIAMISNLGIIDLEGILKYQDAAFKINLPTRHAGNFSLFGLIGLNNCLMEDFSPAEGAIPNNENMNINITEDYDKQNYLLNIGLNHAYIFNSKSYLKTSLALSANGINDDVYDYTPLEIVEDPDKILRDTLDRTLNYKSRLSNLAYRGAVTYNNKIDSRNRIQIGIKYTLFDYDNHQSRLADDLSQRYTLTDFNEQVGTLRNFVSWKHRFNERITMVAGIHNMNVIFNGKSTIEPRLAFKWKVNESNIISVGYGKHSNMERIHNYFTYVQQADGSFIQPNKDLDLLKADHFVLGYQRNISKNLSIRLEAYYQNLYNLPVENDINSSYATINEGLDYKWVDLVNKGTGKNYGVELTIEKYFSNNYYYLINTSVYDSKYTALDGVERNTLYNNNYLLNILCGKEFQNLGRKNNQTLSVNAKIFFGGGRRYIPLLRDEQGNLAVDPQNNNYWDYQKAYSHKLDDISEFTLSVSYKFNRPKATHEIFIDLHNLADNKGRISEYYDESQAGSIGHYTQGGFWPNLMYRVYF